MEIIKANNVVYEYIRRDEEGNVEGITRAVNDVSLDIEQGQFIAILGHNGSGKSTLAKHMNAILNPTEGTLWVDGMDTKDEDNIWKVRQTAGMVFQNPDNQIIGQVVEEDVGFGPENMGIPTEEIWQRVEEILKIAMDPISLETPVGEEDDTHLGDFIKDNKSEVPADAAAYTLLQEQLDEVMQTLTEREKKVLALRFGLEDGRSRTLEEVGKEFHVTRERIRQIEAKALRKLRHPSRSRKLKDYLD